jgi:hypothetical protein
MKRPAHKALLLSTTILLILLALPIAALADGGEDGNEFTQTVNGYQVILAFEKSAAVGENQIHVRVKDDQNMPVSNVDVGVSVVKSESEHTEAEAGASAHDEMSDMPEHALQPPSTGHDTMADMPGMDMSDMPAEAPSTRHDEMVMTALEAGHQNGEYAGKIAIETAGDCVIRVHLTVQGELTEVDFPMNVAQPQNGSGILAVFFAVNVAVIAVAVMLKPKPVSITSSKGA